MAQWFIPWFGQVQYLPTPCCGVPTDEGCTQPLSSDPMINLNTTTFFLIVFFPFARNLHNLESLALTDEIAKKAQSKVGKSNTHKTQIYPMVRPSPILAYSMLWRPNGRGLHSTPFKRSNDQLEYHDFFPYSLFPVCKESSQFGVSRPYR